MPTIIESVPKLHQLPPSLSRENAVEIELEQNVLIFRATENTQNRIEDLLEKQKKFDLSEIEESELRQYEEIDDYLSFLNRLTRNLAESQNGEVS
jgi:hypothetical protein